MTTIAKKYADSAFKYDAELDASPDEITLTLKPVEGDISTLITNLGNHDFTCLYNTHINEDDDPQYNLALFTPERVALYDNLTPILMLGHAALDSSPYLQYILNIDQQLGLNPVYPVPYSDNTLTIGSATVDCLSLLRDREYIEAIYLENLIALKLRYVEEGTLFVIRAIWTQNIVSIEMGNVRVAVLFLGDMSWSAVFKYTAVLLPQLINFYNDNSDEDPINPHEIVDLEEDIQRLLDHALKIEARGLSRFDI